MPPSWSLRWSPIFRSLWVSWLIIAFAGGCKAKGAEPIETIQVYAASSLRDAFVDLKDDFEASHPRTKVALSFAGSHILRHQIERGARAHVFASADLSHVQRLATRGLAGEGRIFATGELVVITPLDNPAGIDRVEDLVRAKRLVLASEAVPLGAYTRTLLARSAATLGATFEPRILSAVVSEENNARLVRAKVELGEADAAIVYRTDALSSDRVRVVEIPPHLNVRARLAITTILDEKKRLSVDAWMSFVGAPQGLKLLARHGFVVE